jgi:hypothetical protein
MIMYVYYSIVSLISGASTKTQEDDAVDDNEGRPSGIAVSQQ